jgi:hypothetical protein
VSACGEHTGECGRTYTASVSEFVWFAQTMLGNALSTTAHAKERTHAPGLAGRRPKLRVLDDDRPIEHVEHGAEE